MTTTMDDRPDTEARKTGDPPDADRMLRGIREEVESTRRQEVEKALERLATEGTVTAKRRRTIEELSKRIVDSLLAAPAETLREAEHRDDREAVNAMLRLFDSGKD